MTSVSSSNMAISMAETPASQSRTRIAFPNAKVNLGLQVRNRRKDGYHNIEECVSAHWMDGHARMEVLEGEAPVHSAHGLAIPGAGSNNLILKRMPSQCKSIASSSAFSPYQSPFPWEQGWVAAVPMGLSP